MAKLVASAFLLIASATGAHGTPACPVGGKMEHWRADFCMWKVGTDDIIAAQPCLEREEKVSFRSSCTAKQHYKRKICGLNVLNGGPSIEKCMADPGFMGPTVRNGGA
ncbi:hypothetical protein [Inhella gelatinilytica]|uniref:Uncharacterized protein n=1 Tax=Inhella gelatinilytica TaxID=2795030 RepID=A0A931IVS1_9BURK|nr:hypothetical protein [Inhella gelatinilytica]MBH9551895.1 hypothetical protein [Inhella gelatinilytica]